MISKKNFHSKNGAYIIKTAVVLSSILFIEQVLAQKVGIGTTLPVSTLNLVGPGSNPTIPGIASTGIFRIGLGNLEGMDMGKMAESPFSGWIQSGYNGFAPDPISLQPNGGNVGIGTTSPINKLSVTGSANISGSLGINTIAPMEKLDVNGKIKIGNDLTTSTAGTIRWNTETSDFEGFNGEVWLSLTETNGNQWPGGETGVGQISDFLQVTSDDGEQGDWFGSSVSIYGDYAVVGASFDDIGANSAQGSAYIFIKSGNTWTQQAKLIADDGVADDRFGTSVAISGDYVIVGANVDDIGANTDQGSAYIFMRSGVSWTQQAKLLATTGAGGDWFGISVALDGDYAIVGAYTDDIGGNSNQGSAYVFVRSGVTWTQQANLVAADGLSEDNFGLSVSISGEYVIVGAHDDHVGSNLGQGSAYIFIRTGNAWSQQAKILAGDGEANDFFGIAVSIDGDYVLVGAYGDDYPPSTDRGSAYIFNRSGSTWTQQAKLTALSGSPNDYYGSSVSILGETIFIGAYNDESLPGCSDPVRIGMGYIYKKQNNIWTLHSTVEDPLGDEGEQFTRSVSHNGDTFIAGAAAARPNGSINQGKVVFGRIN
jgi:FG-GAP repeat